MRHKVLAYSEEAHAAAAAALCRIADLHCGGRIFGTGGGGYNRRNIARARTRVVQSFIEAAQVIVTLPSGSLNR